MSSNYEFIHKRKKKNWNEKKNFYSQFAELKKKIKKDRSQAKYYFPFSSINMGSNPWQKIRRFFNTHNQKVNKRMLVRFKEVPDKKILSLMKREIETGIRRGSETQPEGLGNFFGTTITLKSSEKSIFRVGTKLYIWNSSNIFCVDNPWLSGVGSTQETYSYQCFFGKRILCCLNSLLHYFLIASIANSAQTYKYFSDNIFFLQIIYCEKKGATKRKLFPKLSFKRDVLFSFFKHKYIRKMKSVKYLIFFRRSEKWWISNWSEILELTNQKSKSTNLSPNFLF